MLESIEESREEFTAPLGALGDLVKSVQGTPSQRIEETDPLYKSRVGTTPGSTPD